MFGDAGFDGCERFFFAEQRRQFIAFSIIPLCHISTFCSFSDDCVLYGYILLFRLYIVGRECYI